jgi:hypothetical protein
MQLRRHKRALWDSRDTRSGSRLWCAAALAALLHFAPGCSPAPSHEPSTIEIIGSRTMFEAGVITPKTGSSEFLVIIDLTPAEHYDAEKMAAILREGHLVSLRIREEPDQPPILISDITKGAEVIIRCKTLDEANHIIDRLHAWRSHN